MKGHGEMQRRCQQGPLTDELLAGGPTAASTQTLPAAARSHGQASPVQ